METKRQRQVNEIIKRHMAEVLIEEGRNIYGQAMVSVTNVLVSPDLSQAKIYFSIFNSDNTEEVIKAIDENYYLIKQNLAHRIRNHVRRIPELNFFLDTTLDEMFRVNKLFDKIGPIKSEEE